MEQREKIKIDMSTTDLLITMSEGLPGGVVVLVKLMEDPEGIGRILDLDDMNIRGTQIWIGFKDYCGEDIEKFKTAIKERDPKMIDVINRVGLSGNHEYRAVVHGASFGERPLLEQKEHSQIPARRGKGD